MEQLALKNVNNNLNTNIYSYLETLIKVKIYIEMLFIFSTPMKVRQLWQLETVVSLHCLIHAVPLVK